MNGLSPRATERLFEFVCALAGVDAACMLLTAVARWSGERAPQPIHFREAICGQAVPDEDVAEAWTQVATAGKRFLTAFGVPLFAPVPSRRPPTGNGNVLWFDEDENHGAALLHPSPWLLDMIANPFAKPAPAPLPTPDAMTARWLAIVAAAARDASAAHHFALRCVDGDVRDPHDVAALLVAAGVPAVVAAGGAVSFQAVCLRAGLNAGDAAPVVVVHDDLLVRDGDGDGGDGDDPSASATGSLAFELTPALRKAMVHLRGVYVWRIPATAALPRGLDGILAGVIGPIGHDRAWSELTVRAMAPGLGATGAAAILARVADARRATALASLAVAVAADGIATVDDAATVLARSFGMRPGDAAPVHAGRTFDPRLFVCDHDADHMLERADALARNGARILLWGPPGGGKSAFASHLAESMGQGDPASRPGRGAPNAASVVHVAPASILAHRWGATERLLHALWSRAAAQGAVLVFDEFEALCGVRTDSQSNNASLVRTLTDEFLRLFDRFPSVPVIATVNDVLAVDAAARRRFAFVAEVAAELDPDRERLAWTSILGRDPPSDWSPCGAAVSDVANAAARCRMLGLTDSASHAAAVVAAREARLGTRAKRRGVLRKGAVH